MNPTESGLRTFRYGEISLGDRHAKTYRCDEGVYSHFLAAFGDYSPVHVDEAFACQRGFVGRVMHGAILQGFISHFVGMHFPGRFSLLLGTDLRFSHPSYLDDSIELEAVVSQKVDARQIVVLDVLLTNTTRKWVAARGRLQVMVREES